MDELHAITKLLGEENEKRLRDGITDMILDYVKTDLESFTVYLLDWDEMLHEIRTEIKADIKSKVMEIYADAIKDKAEQMLKEGF